MPLKPKTIEKIYFTIGEVAQELGVANSSVRFWEKEFGNITPRRTGKGDRLYTREQIEQLRVIQQLVKGEGFTIQGAKEKLKRGEAPVVERPGFDAEAMRERLLNVRRKLVDLRSALRTQQ
ncbi:MAG TPA: MerR family transcriptional regulator [Flavobacteriales bacterium]|nr:MerR family transcriptional regulator [Flavobacteriales bacterium]